MNSQFLTNQKGVTLTELMIALALGLLTIGAVYSVHLSQVKRQIVQEDVLAMQQTARASLDMMAREIRMAGYDPMGVNRDADSSNDFYGLDYHPTELHVRADLNGNGVTTDSKESIVYLYDDSTSTLRRKVGRGGRQPVAEHIEDLTFSYRDALGRSTTHAPSIRAVDVEVTARSAHADSHYPENGGYRTWTIRSRIVPRNLQ
ncbi:MAG: prepilin-type N-terminal cleavage/methylation domain-containing protein [Nitrospira sp.]|nr:prepilin-type N-terminal cleavage/methylation domain-containing protein [Nitrospira sp.]